MVTNGVDITMQKSSSEPQAALVAAEVEPKELAKAIEKESNISELNKPDMSKVKTIDELVKELNTDAIYKDIPPEEESDEPHRRWTCQLAGRSSFLSPHLFQIPTLGW
jgi:hypothetical protein